ncbi:MAG: response regulator [Desulfuromonadaceae bacterium]|nr:response regulator [Desulfuromonadaceae bacterium]MDD5105226.1 response regulator [Desulfuromonadaceae bacterium]
MTELKTSNTVSHTIFIVDDDRSSQELLSDMLTRNGYATNLFSSGAHALQAAREEPPDLILLDVMMPDLDGFEVCRLLKESETTRRIPVVLVTCLNEKAMRLKGMAAGADDFINKPFDATEILMRTHNLLLVKKYQDSLKVHSEMLEEQVRQRTEDLETVISELKSAQRQMIQQEKMATIGQLSAGIAHEINNPIGFISSNTVSLAKYCEKILKFMEAQQEALLTGKTDSRDVERLQALRLQMKIELIAKDIPEMIAETLEGVERITSIVRDLKCFSRVDESEQKLVDIIQCLETSINIAHNELKYKATIKREYGDLPQLRCYPQQLGQVFMNLLVNAAHAIDTQGEVTVRAWSEGGNIYVSISDTGCGIPDEVKAHIFEPFFTTKEAGKGTGLGLSISNEIVRNHGGEIMVESEVGHRSTFTVSLPLDYAAPLIVSIP